MNLACFVGILISLAAPSSSCPIRTEDDATRAKANPPIVKKTSVNPFRVTPPDQLPPDERLTKQRKLDDPYHPWEPPAQRPLIEAWRQQVRTQLLVSLGLWPMPKKTPLNVKVTGTIERDDYAIDKVMFESLPGHYVTGNVYRPKNKQGRLPGILNPHGHWANGRFFDAGERATSAAMLEKGEQYVPNSRFPLQARMASLARMGCVVFHYDMVGYADSKVIDHRAFTGVEAMLRLQSVMSLHTWNSIRALDYLLDRSDVDPSRVGVTGASGGGTQTFILCAIDDRPAACFPAVMVSTGMQGGCICENCPLLRIGRNNVEFAGVFAPKPMAMSGADDWTIDIERKGLPELKRLYSLFGQPELVAGKCYPQFKHNYNQVSREMMYQWFNLHFRLGLKDTHERAIDPVMPGELSVFSAKNPSPADAKSARQIEEWWTRESEKGISELVPRSAGQIDAYKRVVGAALKVMIHDEFPAPGDLQVTEVGTTTQSDYTIHRLYLARRIRYATEPKCAVPTIVLRPNSWRGRTVVWLDSRGHESLWDAAAGQPIDPIRKLLAQGREVICPDVLFTGEFHRPNKKSNQPALDKVYAGYTFCYNRTLLAERVRDAVTAVAYGHRLQSGTTVDIVGMGDAGIVALLAKGICGKQIRGTAADIGSFSFASAVKNPTSEFMLPGALKYGDVPGLMGLCAPDPILVSLNGKSAEGAGKYWAVSNREKDFTLIPSDQFIESLISKLVNEN